MDINKTTLIIMAAGMGSRFGGLKQIAPVGPNGETILDFSIHDAKKAGFDNLVFIIKKEIEEDFRNAVGKKAEKIFNTSYVFQEIDSLPSGYSVPSNRVKPWGTSHAVLQSASIVNTPFAVINADDFYGQSTFKIIKEHLETAKDYDYCMAGFLLKNTLTEHGTVARGVCETENGYLKRITERLKIKDMKYTEDDVSWTNLPDDTIVSMNMWGFTPTIYGELQQGFEQFLKNLKDEEKSEYLLPHTVDNLLTQKKATVKVLQTHEKWYGVTYKDDLPFVRQGINKLLERGLYD
ncbi:MAG: sugar phosphate nucleotidyltransferase [Firmicutes bacterium]|nr:sugar phosphate nucleotidyltransferase [Bacillota bacterium]